MLVCLRFMPESFRHLVHDWVTATNVQLARTHEAFMYYQLHKSRNAPSMDSLLLWMTGGPGASSLVALYEGDERPCQSLDPDRWICLSRPFSVAQRMDLSALPTT